MRWAAIFPGQGSQHTGMGKELFENFKIAQTTFEEASDILKINMRKLCFEGPDSELKLTANAQPALLVCSAAAWRVMGSECNSLPFATLGHSLGEYSALLAAEGLSFQDAAETVRLRGFAMQDAVPVGAGSMMAVLGLEDNQVIKACKDFQLRAHKEGGLKSCVIEAANFNSPGQVVVSGHEKALQFMKDNLMGSDYGATRARMIPLAVSAPFHCSLMKPAQERLRPKLESITWTRKMKFGVIHNSNAELNYNGEAAPKYLFDQVAKPVLWTSSIKATSAMEIDTFIEFGAGKVLSGLVRKILPEAKIHNVDGLESFKLTLAALEAHQ